MTVAGAAREVAATARTLTTGTSDGFAFLGTGRRGGSAVGCGPEAFVVESLADLRRMERELDWPMGAFEIDFSTHLVFAYRLPRDYCQEYVEPLTIRLHADGRLEPKQPTTLVSDSCGYMQPYANATNLVVIARSSLPQHGFLFRHLEGRVGFFALKHPAGRRSPVPEVLERSNSPISGSVLGVFPLPSLGDAQAVRLLDGRPIWLVHHDDGSLSALDARIDLVGQFSGLGLAARWDRASRRFNHTLDEYGGAGVHGPDLRRFELEVSEPDHQVKIGRHALVEKRRVQRPLVQPARSSVPAQRYEKAWPWLSLEEAAGAPEGSTVLVNAQLVLEPSKPARLCAAERHHRASRCVAVSPDIRPQADDGLKFLAPTFVTVRDGRFTEPMVTDMRVGPP